MSDFLEGNLGNLKVVILGERNSERKAIGGLSLFITVILHYLQIITGGFDQAQLKPKILNSYTRYAAQLV
jgi:hypothetical protein